MLIQLMNALYDGHHLPQGRLTLVDQIVAVQAHTARIRR
jgi:hypothetical protein